MQDDCFLMCNLSASDVASPFLGPVFRMQRDLTVTGMAPEHVEGDPDGEWPGLRLSNFLLGAYQSLAGLLHCQLDRKSVV